MKEIIASIVIIVVMTGSALWVRNDTAREAHERFKDNAVRAYVEARKCRY